ncbi:MAG: NAD(P)-binding domain-containing protein, partial [Bacteroidales bacterium]
MGPETRITLLGGGSWGTALAKLFLNNISRLQWFIRSKEDILFIEKYQHNPKYLTSIKLDTTKISFFSDICKAIESSDLIVVAIPAPFLEESLMKCLNMFDEKFIVSAVKGIV